MANTDTIKPNNNKDEKPKEERKDEPVKEENKNENTSKNIEEKKQDVIQKRKNIIVFLIFYVFFPHNLFYRV